MLNPTRQAFSDAALYAHGMSSSDADDYRLSTAAPDYEALAAPLLPPTLTGLFTSLKRTGRFSMPAELQLKAAFAEFKLDLREALFPQKHVLIVAESLCASVEVLLPPGVTVVDHGTAIFSSHKVSQVGEETGPVIHVDGWSVCSDVKFLSVAD